MVKAAAPAGLCCIKAPGVLVAPLLQLVVPERLELLACGMSVSVCQLALHV